MFNNDDNNQVIYSERNLNKEKRKEFNDEKLKHNFLNYNTDGNEDQQIYDFNNTLPNFKKINNINELREKV